MHTTKLKPRHRALLEKAAKKRRIKLLDDEPKLFQDLQFIWDAFYALSPGRQVAFDVCPLTNAEIMSYLTMCGFSGMEALDDMYLIRVLDVKFLELLRKDRDADT